MKTSEELGLKCPKCGNTVKMIIKVTPSIQQDPDRKEYFECWACKHRWDVDFSYKDKINEILSDTSGKYKGDAGRIIAIHNLINNDNI